MRWAHALVNVSRPRGCTTWYSRARKDNLAVRKAARFASIDDSEMRRLEDASKDALEAREWQYPISTDVARIGIVSASAKGRESAPIAEMGPDQVFRVHPVLRGDAEVLPRAVLVF